MLAMQRPHWEHTLGSKVSADESFWEKAMDTLKLCRAMEAVCVQHALSDARLRDRWLDLMDDWNIRAHSEVSRRFQESWKPLSANEASPSSRRA
jgi:hypothetical protein